MFMIFHDMPYTVLIGEPNIYIAIQISLCLHHYTAKEMAELLLNKKVPLTKIAPVNLYVFRAIMYLLLTLASWINQKTYVLMIWALGHVMANVVCIAVLMMKGILNILVGLDRNTWILQTRTV